MSFWTPSLVRDAKISWAFSNGTDNCINTDTKHTKISIVPIQLSKRPEKYIPRVDLGRYLLDSVYVEEDSVLE